jgi:hypothetical protein
MFRIICISVRLLLSLAAKHMKDTKYLGYLAIIPAFGFMIIFLGGYRKVGIETNGCKIWWNNLRPVHSILYFVFSYLAINNNASAFKVLLADAILGALVFLLRS